MYDEGVTGKGTNNVASNIMETLDGLDLSKSGDSGGELNIFLMIAHGTTKKRSDENDSSIGWDGIF